jgi:hypothetical protein
MEERTCHPRLADGDTKRLRVANSHSIREVSTFQYKSFGVVYKRWWLIIFPSLSLSPPSVSVCLSNKGIFHVIQAGRLLILFPFAVVRCVYSKVQSIQPIGSRYAKGGIIQGGNTSTLLSSVLNSKESQSGFSSARAGNDPSFPKRPKNILPILNPVTDAERTVSGSNYVPISFRRCINSMFKDVTRRYFLARYDIHVIIFFITVKSRRKRILSIRLSEDLKLVPTREMHDSGIRKISKSFRKTW